MRTSVLLAVAAALGVVAPVPSHASRPVPRADAVLLLEAAGYPVSTTFDTEPERAYTITVSGVYTYDGTLGLGLADCGHKDPEDETSWINWANVLVDGRSARCTSQPFQQTHSYTWTQPGTGAPFQFEIYANTYTDDDTGCLVVTVSEVGMEVPAGVPGSGPVQPRRCWRMTD